jgi:hypothetical protein
MSMEWIAWNIKIKIQSIIWYAISFQQKWRLGQMTGLGSRDILAADCNWNTSTYWERCSGKTALTWTLQVIPWALSPNQSKRISGHSLQDFSVQDSSDTTHVTGHFQHLITPTWVIGMRNQARHPRCSNCSYINTHTIS